MFEVIPFEVYQPLKGVMAGRSADRDTDKLLAHLAKSEKIVVLEKRSSYLQKSCNRQTLRQNVDMFQRRGTLNKTGFFSSLFCKTGSSKKCALLHTYIDDQLRDSYQMLLSK